MREAAKRLGLTMTVAISRKETLGPLYVNRVPSTVFVDAGGVIRFAASGARGEGFFMRRAKALLGD